MYTMVFLPVWLGIHFMFLSTKSVLQMITTGVYQYFFESLLRRNNILSKTIIGSKTIQTIIFMLCSTLILHGKRTYDVKGFWLTKSNRSITDDDENEECKRYCKLHPNINCINYIWKGTLNSFLMGLVIDCFGNVKRMTKQSTLTNRWREAIKLRLYLAPLFSLYIGLYRVK
uniref:Uncharacterized protein n=1 Tax=Glossina brevipalpis TaxID=37001 RepID=A0A1A9W1P3_9MUSC